MEIYIIAKIVVTIWLIAIYAMILLSAHSVKITNIYIITYVMQNAVN